MREGPNGGGLSRKAILSEIDNSLRRLGTDYVDLYQIHRWDYATPIEETMEALHDVVKAGKARYIGASAMFAWQFQQALHVAEKARLDALRLDAESPEPDLPRRGARDAAALPRRGDRRDPVQPARRRPPDARLDGGQLAARPDRPDRGRQIRRDGRADRRSSCGWRSWRKSTAWPRAQIALAWLLQKTPVTAPIIGATKFSHLEEAVGALAVKLTPEEVAWLEDPYVPHRVVGHQ
jgi:aryl-alcohol dehydrogenase-like predicted oxidoreductase